METAPVSEDYKQLRVAQEKVLRSLEVAADLLDELSKLSRADKTLVRSYCEQYLSNIQEVQAILVPAVQKFSQSRPYEANSYLTRVQADAACSHADALTAQVDSLHQSMSQVSFVMKESQGRLHVDDPMED